jgi:type IX secretion system PorP/SprF family membrane protein
MKKFLTIIGFSFGSISVFSQQDPQFTQFMHNKLFMNPGYAGMSHALCFTGIARQQWAGFDGSPRSGVFSGDYYFDKLSGGIGINFLYDQLGFENNMAFRVNYSFHRTLGNGEIGFGIEGGVLSKRLGPTGSNQWMATTNWQADPTIPPQIRTRVMDMGAGIWYQNSKLWLGISSTHLNGKLINGGTQVMNIPNGNPPIVTHTLLYQMARHYFITGGANLPINNSWEIRPSFLVKSDATTTSVDLNVTAMFNQRFWFGVSYRFADAVCPMVGFQWTNNKPAVYADATDDAPRQLISAAKSGGTMKIGFAYDYTTSNLKNYNSGTFELFLNYCIPFTYTPPTTKVWDTRQGNW